MVRPPAPGIVPNFFDAEAIEREHRRFMRWLYLMGPRPQPLAPEPPKPPEPDLLISQAEAAKRLGVRRERIAALVSSGKLPTVRVGKRERIRPRDLDSLLARGDLDPPKRGRPRKPRQPEVQRVRRSTR